MVKLKFGVPSSRLSDKIKDVEIFCTSEEEAMAIGAGCWLAGKEATVYMQDTGLCRCFNVILTLFKPYEIPLPKLILSIRHYPYHHHFVGKLVKKLLQMIDYKNLEIVEQ